MIFLTKVSKLDWSTWLRGIIGSFISGGSSAIVGGVTVSGIDSEHYNFATHRFYVLVVTLFLANGVISLAKFLSATPLPDELKTGTHAVAVTGTGTGKG